MLPRVSRSEAPDSGIPWPPEVVTGAPVDHRSSRSREQEVRVGFSRVSRSGAPDAGIPRPREVATGAPVDHRSSRSQEQISGQVGPGRPTIVVPIVERPVKLAKAENPC